MADAPIFSSKWQLQPSPTPLARRSAEVFASDRTLAALTGDRFEVAQTFVATSPQRRGVEPLPPLDVTMPAEPGALYVLAVRQQGSGALSFHATKEVPVRRGVGTSAATVTFEVEIADVPEEQRRSIVTKAIKGVVLKAAGKFADIAVPWVGSEVEDFIWKKKGLTRGWLQVTPATLTNGLLGPADFSAIKSESDRCLLLLHGTFSNTAGAFGGLTTTRSASGQDFFTAVAPLYGNRIYAFNHFTVSQTPEQNAIDLIAGLPVRATFDVITHSRGGLVLRNLVERSSALGGNAANFQLGKAILVAAPNLGTPLATADRFDKLISWWANLLELFPDNPFTLTAEYIGEGLNFIARHVVDALPGLDSMNMSGGQITALNQPPSAPAGAYYALVSNYQPTGNVLARLADLGIDGIFGMANDLVVPSEGSWKMHDRKDWVPGTQIGCFGNNVTSAARTDVTHTTYFTQPETIDFLIRTLTGQPMSMSAMDPDIHLPFLLRRGLPASPVAPGVPAMAPSPAGQISSSPGFLAAPPSEADNVLHLFLISTDDYLPKNFVTTPGVHTAILLATYRNARVVETIYLEAPKDQGEAREDIEVYWNQINQFNDRIRGYVDGASNTSLPSQEELHNLGVSLFNAMFPGTVRRLYDVARVDRSRAGKRLDIVITSMINWVADKPWEFAYDPSRESFLATEAVNFTRNVLTGIPAEEPIPHADRPLHILVVVAQPIGMGLLSATEEERVVGRGFQRLIDANLATVEFMLTASIEKLHDRLRLPDIDILHFIGHGEYNEDEKEGFLIFEDPDGGFRRISAENLRQVLCQRGIRLVFLNACETGMVGRNEDRLDFNRGVAPKLVAGGIPVLVANQYKVLDVSATEFAKHFYWWLALGSTVGDAAREARVAVNYSVAGETIDWAVPVVYARNPGSSIYTEEEKTQVETTLVQLAEIKKPSPCKGFKGLRLALWDVNHVLPELDEVATAFNTGQKQFCFQTTEVSAPVGTWRRTFPAGGGPSKACIVGDEVAAKLIDQVASLGVDRLICITTFALADKEQGGLALWNEDKNQRVTIISAELVFARMDQSRSGLRRFLANMIVSALCGADLDHTAPPETCPNHHFERVNQDPASRFAYLTAAEQFCDDCIRKFKSPLQMEALNRILATW